MVAQLREQRRCRGCGLLGTPESLRTPIRKPRSPCFAEDGCETCDEYGILQSGQPSTSSRRALSEGSCLRRSSTGKSQHARRTSILELGPEERIRALGVPERLGNMPRQRKQSLGPPQRKQPNTARVQTPRATCGESRGSAPLGAVLEARAPAETTRTASRTTLVSHSSFPMTPRSTRPRARARTVAPCTPRSPHASARRPERPRVEARAGAAGTMGTDRSRAPPPRWRY